MYTNTSLLPRMLGLRQRQRRRGTDSVLRTQPKKITDAEKKQQRQLRSLDNGEIEYRRTNHRNDIW